MSRGPWVANMECRGIDRIIMSTYKYGGPLHHQTYLVHHDNIHHISVFPKDNVSCSMRYKSGILVSVTLILDACMFHLKLLLIIKCVLGSYVL
jgi:hypothetical protein